MLRAKSGIFAWFASATPIGESTALRSVTDPQRSIASMSSFSNGRLLTLDVSQHNQLGDSTSAFWERD